MNSFFERRYVIGSIFIVLTLILLGRLFYIQIIDDRYLLSANSNVIRKSIKYPDRGPILDRNGKLLVGNELVYDISVVPKEVKPFDTLEFCRLLGIDKDEFDKRLLKAKKYGLSSQSPFDKQLSPELYASLQERLAEFPGFTVDPHPVRTYPDSTAAQFLGYIGEAADIDIKKSGGYYRPGDYVGITGVEKAYENALRGQRGVQNNMVDARGNKKGIYANGAFDTLAVAGERLTSSLDITIQKMGEKLMKNKVGAIVAIEPSTGEILAFVSSPTYDPNLLVGQERGNNAAVLYKDPYSPFLIRPIQAYYPPGSSFKPLSALIALQEGIITPQTTYYCAGSYRAGNRSIPCFNHEKHGLVNLSSAVAESCNGYFDMVFEKVINAEGRKAIEPAFTNWRENVLKFGLSSRLGLDLPAERPGRLYTAAKYDKIYRPGGWRSSTIISLAIGQGEVDATPLQLANIECIIANQGYYYTPHLIKTIGTRNITRTEDTVKHYAGISPQHFEPVIDGMQAVVDHGTAAGSKIPGIVMVGKTGTAQVHGKDNSVFVAFAPRDHPRIAIAVVVENAGQGARWAAPIASYLVEQYLTGKISRPQEEFNRIMNTNLLPAVSDYYQKDKKSTQQDSLKKSRLDSARKVGPVKSASNKNKNNRQLGYLTAIKRKNDE